MWLDRLGDVGSSRGRTQDEPEASGSGAAAPVAAPVAAAAPVADSMDTTD